MTAMLNGAEFLDRIEAGMWRQDADGRCLWANAALLRRLGLPREGVVGRRVADLWPAVCAQQLAAVTAQTLDDGLPRTSAWQADATHWLEFRLSRIAADELGVLVCDISAHKADQQRLRAALAEVETDLRRRTAELAAVNRQFADAHAEAAEANDELEKAIARANSMALEAEAASLARASSSR